MGGLKKEADADLKVKAMAACVVITTQDYFDPGLPNAILRTLYRGNVRSVLLYGTPSVKDVFVFLGG